MANVGARTQKVKEYIENNYKENQIVTLSTELLEDATGEKLSENAKVSLRKTVPFSIGNVIPVLQEGKKKNMVRSLRPMGLKLVSEKEYLDFKFTEENFRALEKEEIDDVTSKLKAVRPNADNNFIQKMLTLCDVIVLKNGRNVYKPVKLRLLSSYILEPVDATQERLDILVKAKVLKTVDSTYCFVTDESKAKVTNTEHVFENHSEKANETKVLKNLDRRDLRDIIKDVNAMEENSINSYKQTEQQTSEKTSEEPANEGIYRKIYNLITAANKEHSELIKKLQESEARIEQLTKELEEAHQAKELYEGTRRQFLAVRSENEKLKQSGVDAASIEQSRKKIISSLDNIEEHIGKDALKAAQKFLLDNNEWKFQNAVTDAVRNGFQSLVKLV